MQGSNIRILIYVGIIWLGISTILFMLFETIISLLSSAVLLILLIWYIRREPNQRPTTKFTNDDKITKINRDCANICRTASQFMSRDSQYSKQYAMFVPIFVKHVLRNVNNTLIWNHCQKCAQVCRRCAEECRKI
jgi:uncharacterized protein DUF326